MKARRRVFRPEPTTPCGRLGLLLTRERLARRMAQADAAQAIGLSVSQLSRIETGTNMPTLDGFARLAALYGLSDRQVRQVLIDLAEGRDRQLRQPQLDDLTVAPGASAADARKP
jgi:transcriptional regulator with XRE-family HTH domain